MKEKLTETIKLDNNQELKIYDASKKISVDACFIKVIFRIEIEIKESVFSEEDLYNINIDQIKNKLGDIVVFELIKERNFIDIDEKDHIFKSLKDEYLKSSSNYISKQNFPQKYILKKYND